MSINCLIVFGITVSLLLGSFCRPAAAGPVLPRENINVFSQDAAKLAKLRNAVDALQARPPADASRWFNLAGIHGIKPNDPEFNSAPSLVQALWNQCHRDESLFFLWHRAYVASLERLMQDAIHDPDFRLPYWNWYADPSLPEAFRGEFLDPQHSKRNPLFIANRNKGLVQDVNGGKPVWTPRIVTNYGNPSFAAFQAQLDGAEHGTIHVAVGTPSNMGAVTSAARDPIFYLHHANIDRLLQVWLKNNPNGHHAPGAFPQWDAAVYRFPVPGGGVATPSVQDLALNSMEALGYRYDDVGAPEVPVSPLPARPADLQAPSAQPSGGLAGMKMQTFAVVRAPDKPIEVGAGGTVTLAVEPAHRERFRALMEMEPLPKVNEAPEALTIVLEDVRLREASEGLLSYHVFVNLPGEGGSREGATFSDHYLGDISLFGLGHAAAEHDVHAGHDAHTGASVRLPLSSAAGAGALLKEPAGDGSAPKVSLSFVPVLAPGASVPDANVLSIGQIRLEGSVP